MLLKIASPEKRIYEGRVEKVTIPTEAWEITILPHHQPLSSVIKPWLLRLKPEQLDESEGYIISQGEIAISLSKGVLFVDGENIIITTAAATTSPEESAEVLEQMKQDMQAQLEKIRVEGSVEDLEKAMINLQKITADLRLVKLKNVK